MIEEGVVEHLAYVLRRHEGRVGDEHGRGFFVGEAALAYLGRDGDMAAVADGVVGREDRAARGDPVAQRLGEPLIHGDAAARLGDHERLAPAGHLAGDLRHDLDLNLPHIPQCR